MTAAKNILADALCLHCDKVFQTRKPWREMFCSEECRTERRRTRDRSREKDRRRVKNLEQWLHARMKNRQWCEQHRKCRTVQPWLAGAPPFDAHLPGGSFSIAWSPQPKWPMEHRNIRGLHGAMTAVFGMGHHGRHPKFALFPHAASPTGWAVHIWELDVARQFAGTTVNGALWDRPTQFRFGPLVRWKSPVVKTRRKHAVTLEAVTPVIIRSMGGRIHRLTPTSDYLQGSLGGSWVQRFGLEFLDREKLIRVEVVKTRTETVVTDLGGKFGKVPGWIGRVDLLINAPGLWLLRTAERLGLGSRTAFGFGRIVVTDTEVMPC